MTIEADLPALPSRKYHVPATSIAREPSPHVSLPHLTRPSGDLHDAKPSPRRHRPEFQDFQLKTPIEQAISDIRQVTGKIRASFDRMNQTEHLLEKECAETRALIQQVKAEQEATTWTYVVFFTFHATQIQRLFRGHQARRAYCELLAVRAVLRIQRAFRAKQSRRAERRRRFRIMSRKILRGLKGIRARDNLSHNEIIDRVSHNMQIERQWRMAMGVADSESDLIHALYRRKFVRKQMVTLFQSVMTMAAVVHHLQRLVRQRHASEHEAAEEEAAITNVDDLTLDLQDVFITTAGTNGQEQEQHPSPAKANLFSVTQQLSSSRSAQAKSTSRTPRVTREDLRRKQKLYTQRIYEENLKKESVRAAQLEKQREVARLAAEARKQHEEEQRRLRLEQAQVLRDDLDRRGLLAIKELQSKKEEEVRKEEEVIQRVAQAKQRIAQEVLSDETQTLLMRRQRGGGGQ